MLILQKDLIGMNRSGTNMGKKSVGIHAELRGEWATRREDNEVIATGNERRKLKGRRRGPGIGVVLVVF